MKTRNWKNHLKESKDNVGGFIQWIDDLSREENLLKNFLTSLWMNDKTLSENENLEFILNDSNDSDAWLYSTQELACQKLESQTFDWHNQYVGIYQEILKDFYQDKNEKAFIQLKRFLAKTKVGVKYSFFEEMTRLYEQDYLLKMDLGLLNVIRATAMGNDGYLDLWEEDCSERIESCLNSPSVNNCEPCLYLLPIIGFLWREKAPEDLLRKCFELEFQWNKKPDPAALNHLLIYFRQAILILCQEEKWDQLIDIKKYARSWVKELIESSLSHPSLEDFIDQLNQIELEHANTRMSAQSASDLETAFDEMTRE